MYSLRGNNYYYYRFTLTGVTTPRGSHRRCTRRSDARVYNIINTIIIIIPHLVHDKRQVSTPSSLSFLFLSYTSLTASPFFWRPAVVSVPFGSRLEQWRTADNNNLHRVSIIIYYIHAKNK